VFFRVHIPFFIVCSLIVVLKFINVQAGNAEDVVARNDIPSDSVTKVLDHVYSKWTINNRQLLQLSEIAEKEFTADSNEISERISLYHNVFPNIFINKQLLKAEIVTEKYLRSYESIIPSPEEVDQAYAELLSLLPDFPVPPKNDVLPIINCRALFSTSAVSELCKVTEAKIRSEREKLWAKQSKNWSTDELAIRAESEQCIVSSQECNTCIATVGEYNSYLQLQMILTVIDKKKAREFALNKFLSSRYCTEQNRKNNLSENVLKVQQHRIEDKLLSRHMDTPLSQIDDNDLMYVYNKYYPRFFRNRKIKSVAILGSSDSLYIDSLYQRLSHLDHLKGQNRLSNIKSFFSALPLVYVSSDDLPDTINTLIDTLRIQDFRTLHTPFGHFICRIVADRRQLEIRPNEARKKLLYLAMEERKRFKDKSEELCAKNYYDCHESQYVTPDTLRARTWLLPSHSIGLPTITNQRRQQPTTANDTISFSSLNIMSYNLPPDVESELLNAYKGEKKKSSLFGPIYGIFGTWYFKVENAKIGGVKLPFDSVKSSIINEMQVQGFPMDSMLKTENGEKVVNQEIITAAFYAGIPAEVDSIPDEEIEKCIINKTVNVPYKKGGKIDAKLRRYARQKIMDKKIDTFQQKSLEWIQSLTIDNELLYSGCN
jgi:hypothetical protein